MIAVDTNIIVRLLTGDDPRQAGRAARMMEEYSIFIPKSVVLETEWVLRHAYDIDPGAIRLGFEKLLGLANVTVEDAWSVRQSLAWYARGLDFADALHLASRGGASRFATFDKKMIKKALNISPVKVFEP